MNWYVYASNNPVKFVDPTGLASRGAYLGNDPRNPYTKGKGSGSNLNSKSLSGSASNSTTAITGTPSGRGVLLKYIAEKNGATITPVQKLLDVEHGKPLSYGLDYVEVTIGDITKQYRGNIINGRMIVDPIQFGKDFNITDGSKLMHESGDAFETADDAALAWALTYNGVSILNGREYSASIYADGGKFKFTQHLVGTSKSVSVPSVPAGKTMVGIVHTHGAYDPDYLNEVFSGHDADKGVAHEFGVPVYLATPGGYFKKYNPSNLFKEVNFGAGLPYDLNSPKK